MKKNHIFPITIFSLFLYVVFSCTPHQTLKDENVQEAKEFITHFMDTSNIPGLAVTVSKEGKIIWSEGFGYADLEQMVPVQPGWTKFRIGSISKSLTSYAIAILYEQGKLDIDAPINNYIPSFPNKDIIITTRQLAGHLAGIRHYKGREFFNKKRYESVTEGLGIFMNDSLLFTPGSDYKYSSYGWNLISVIIENTTRKDFLEFMEEGVFEPLQMFNTKPDYLDSLIAGRTRYYTLNDSGKIINASYVDNSYKWAGGGFLSTSEDLVKFGNVLLNPQSFENKTVTEFTTSQITTKGDTTNYGIGWRIGMDDSGHRWFGHGGTSVGGRSQLLIYPESKVVIVILTNASKVDFSKINRFTEIFFN